MIEEKAASYLANQAKRNAEVIKLFMIERVNDIHLLSSIWCNGLIGTHLEF